MEDDCDDAACRFFFCISDSNASPRKLLTPAMCVVSRKATLQRAMVGPTSFVTTALKRYLAQASPDVLTRFILVRTARKVLAGVSCKGTVTGMMPMQLPLCCETLSLRERRNEESGVEHDEEELLDDDDDDDDDEDSVTGRDDVEGPMRLG